MQPGDGQEMLQTRLAKCLFDLFGDRPAFAGDQRRGNPTRGAGKHGGDAPRHLGSQMPQILAPAALNRPGLGRIRLGNAARAAKCVADPADLREIRLALKVVPARQGLAGHRIEHRLEADPVAGVEQIAGLRDVQAKTPGLLLRVEAGQRIGGDDDPPSLVQEVDIDDPPGDRHRPEVSLEHRRFALQCGHSDQPETGGEDAQRQCGFE